MVQELKKYSCVTCGAPLKEWDGKFVCPNCKNEYRLEEKISEEEVVALNRATTDRNLLRFDDAFEEYDLLLKKYPKNELANWGAFLSFYGIVYEQDTDGKYIPTCHRLSEKPVESSKYYYLFNAEHKQRAQEIERLRVSIMQKAQRIPPYDVFICYKATEERFGRPYPTKESSWARDVYEMLTHELKLRVFFAEKSLGDSNEEYEPHIYSALNSAKLMLVLTTGMENVNAVWVKNEWKRYSKYIQEGKKKTIRVVYDNIEPYDLPLELQKTQAINHNEMDWGKKVKKAAEVIFIDPLEEERKKKEAEEQAKKAAEAAAAREAAREEELRKMREAMEALKKQANTPQAAPAPTPAAPKPVLPADKYCVKCGAGNVENAKFCSSCGHKEFAPEFKKYCFECGTERGLLEKICPECGENRCVYTKEDYKKEVENRERRRRIEEEQAAREAQKRELVRMQMEAAARLAAQEAEEKRRKEAIARDFTIVRGILEKYKGADKNVVIPDGVTSIGESAFEGRVSLTTIEIPEGVISIGESAFEGCSNLISINIPNSVVNISKRAFMRCKRLPNIIIPNGIKTIESQTFLGCHALTNIIIPNSVTTIEDYAFENCGLTSITIPDSVTSIGTATFKWCGYLKSISIPSKVTRIADSLFAECYSLSNVIIPKSVTIIDSYAFERCSALDEITIPDGVTSIGHYAFSGCTRLTEITMPKSVKGFGYSAFCYCVSLTRVVIPNGIMYITETAFKGCNSLKDITIPDGVIEIGRDAFEGCSNLISINIPNSVISIARDAFSNCGSLMNIIIPYSVKNIGVQAFKGCNNLTIYAQAEKKPKDWQEKRGFLGIGITESWNSDNRPVVWGYKGN